MSWRGALPVLSVWLMIGCGGDDAPGAAPGKGAGGRGGSGGNGGSQTMVGPLSKIPPAQIPPPDPSAVVIPNIDSAVINVDAVDGAKDYRAFVMADGVDVLTDSSGHEVVKGATIFCAGLRQRGAPALPEPEVIQQIEVTDIHEPTTFVVEAIDELCPFQGLFGLNDDSFNITSPDAIQNSPDLVRPVPVLSEATMRSKYDNNFIVNGQGPNTQQPGQPADNVVPTVLKRWTVEVKPLDSVEADKRKTATFFSDFSENDQPVMLDGGDNPDGTFHEPPGRGYSLAIYQNKQFDFYATNAEFTKGNHAFIDRSQLQILLPDASQDTMSSVMAIPRTLAHFTDTGYLHVTFENSTDSTSRRYWWLSLCGTDTAGGTFDSNDYLTKYISLTSGFFDSDGSDPSVVGWNCLVVFPHDGIATHVPPSGNSNPQSSIIVLIHKSGAPDKQSAVDVSPQQLNASYPAAWYRLMKGSDVTETGIVDDVLQMAPRIRFDMYVSRQRLVMYVNGEQRICNDFGPQKLTMAEAAVGFNDALYHSSAEHTEMTLDFADRSGQLQYLRNTIFADMHSWDNVGFEEDVALPDSYSDADCYTYSP